MGVAKRYRYPHERPEPRPSEAELAAQVEAMCSELLRRYRSGASRPATLTDAELWVTPETWQEVVDMVRHASAVLHERAVRPRTEGTVKVNLTVAAFRMEGRS
ncbi:hypothetical protein [Nocardioides sp. TF02-7]|uniref:hypothetical protein n=1 Tax=Nocardioides sp. TF02-7 TaxID=2917724 RepID=UPI001F0530C7|nr:hypothetical protein [Nocardioides sp. TF02-7]UMG91644.1 hypothetical protein MF408_16335 [Nocardioides sp. TF02-7]